VGLLGFGAIGAAHARAVRETAGLHLVAVCDRDPARAAQALEADPDARIHANADMLLADPDVDIVVVSTPPDSHAAWAMAALEHGKHVVLEKPMALTARECDALIERARSAGLALSVYQNRRFDPDYALMSEAVREGRIGEVFHVETFIGGYGHPCNYWHSDAAVSGGALFDWGSHVTDQVLDLLPGEVESVSAVNHKRVWHDVTNADHSRMTLHFSGGREATFVYSDLAAALKPRWYVLGTRGALTGEWRHASVVSRNAIGTLDEDMLAPADAPPSVRLHSSAGDVTDLALRAAEPHPFHADLSLWLQYGFVPRVRGEQSRRVISMLEAAEESARMGGIPVKPS
jgi:predicted dehydrogenase